MRSSLLATPDSFDNRALGTARAFTAWTMSAPSDAPAGEGLDRDWLLGLATALQTSLEVDAMIETFARYSNTLVPHDGVEFVAEQHDVSFATVPLADHRCSYNVVVREQRLGSFTFTRTRPFTAEELSLLETVLANLVHPLRNALMYREAVQAAARDPLTGLSNRASLDNSLEREVELARRHCSPFSIAMVDIDRFKRINDQHGHDTGDRALMALARTITHEARDSDMVCRYGGEEFCLLLSNTGLDGARTLGERVRRAIEHARVEVEGYAVPVTTSVGVAELRPGESGTALLKRADMALYRAKRGGRNQVVSDPL